MRKPRSVWKIISILFCMFLLTMVLSLAYSGSALAALGWYRMNSNTTQGLEDFWGSASNDVFAVGGDCTILHYDGNTWTPMTNAFTGSGLVLGGVWGTGPTDIFAGGQDNLILHYNGTTWDNMTSLGTGQLRKMWGSSHNDVFVVGRGDASGNGYIEHYDGTTWSTMSIPTTEGMWGIWGSASNDVWAGGDAGSILHYNGDTWSVSTVVSGSVYGIWNSGPADVFAVDTGGHVYHYDGNNWTSVTIRVGEVGVGLSDVWGSDSNDVFAVGGYYDGTWHSGIVHYDGTSWTVMAAPPPGDLWLAGLWGSSGTDVFAGGTAGYLLHYGYDCSQTSTATGTGIATLCTDNGTIQTFTGIDPSQFPGKPANLVFPDGMFHFVINGVGPNGTTTVYLQLPSGIPANAEYWGYNDEYGWDQIPYTVVSANEISITLTDGGTGDYDGINGTIYDPSGLGGPGGGETATPVFPSIYVGIAAAAGAFVLAYFAGRRLIAQKRA